MCRIEPLLFGILGMFKRYSEVTSNWRSVWNLADLYTHSADLQFVTYHQLKISIQYINYIDGYINSHVCPFEDLKYQGDNYIIHLESI